MIEGGRRAALARLAAIRPARYAGSRNFLDGLVSRLSPYLRHGVLELADVRDAALGASAPQRIGKFIIELAWRDYWRRVLGVLGDDVWDDLDVYKTGFAPDDYAPVLPADLVTGTTGLRCMDAFVRDLVDDGYVHNHARMWFASYVVHHRRVDWRAGARFYYTHLLDGDVASNTLSWQWVASTFAVGPYIFNRENLSRYTRDVYCSTCPLARGGCPFDAPYNELRARLFPNPERPAREPRAIAAGPDPVDAEPAIPATAIVWHHADALSRSSPARRAAPAAPALWVRDDAFAAEEAWSANRRRFIAECAADLEAEQRDGATAATVIAFATEHGATHVVTDATPDPHLRATIAAIGATLEVVVVPARPFARIDRAVNLGRFSRYWGWAEASAFSLTGGATDIV